MAKNKDLLELIWEFFQYYYQNKNLRKGIFSESRGKKFLIELNNNSNIAKYQWNYESNGIYNLLEPYYIPNFLNKMTRIAIDYKIDKTLLDSSSILKELFEEQFSVLEKDILLSDSFQYTIYIPVFRVHFPKEEKEIKFDAKHRLLDITEIDEPFEVINFKDNNEIPVDFRNQKPDIVIVGNTINEHLDEVFELRAEGNFLQVPKNPVKTRISTKYIKSIK